ncbi:hypothetical protein [Acinetobacter baumannii]|uniref:hypothetical protein n=1 Tax=Acinetobacter baumannii TaxID=470 RepID=UPI000B940E5F|nr:hypothetical protein [Acinetobacter baumannii]OYD38530.1 hypothetical protein CFE65_08475 [Acinetobacter baumannii]
MAFITAAEAAKIAEASQPFTSSYLLEEINRHVENLAKLGERELYYPSLKTRTSLDTIQKVESELSNLGYKVSLDSRDNEKYILHIVY